MALYVHLVKMTHQGASKIREMSSTYETVRKFGESLGCKPPQRGRMLWRI
jgi:uncharacterized protein with GYD domain